MGQGTKEIASSSDDDCGEAANGDRAPSLRYEDGDAPGRKIAYVAGVYFLAAGAFAALVTGHLEWFVDALGMKISQADWADLAEWAVFLLQLCIFSAMWTVYFLSHPDLARGPDAPFQVRSLRRLLAIESLAWQPTGDSKPDDKVRELESLREKALAGMQLLSVLIAVSVLELGHCLNTLASIHNVGPNESAHRFNFWEQTANGVGMLCAFASLTCFVISADSMDTVFNRFRTGPHRKLTRHFYQQTLTPKYIGLVLVLAGAALSIATYSAVLGTTALALLVAVGYPHWFPSEDVAATPPPEETAATSRPSDLVGFAIRWAFVPLPFILDLVLQGP